MWVSSDTWPGAGGVLGRTKAQIAEAEATGVEPTRSGGFGYLACTDGAGEYAGNHPAERFNHVHLYHEDPFCPNLWYRTTRRRGRPGPRAAATHHGCRLPGREGPTDLSALDRDGMFRRPSATVASVTDLPSYMRQGERPLVSSRGALDHIRPRRPGSRRVDRQAARRGRAAPRRRPPARRHPRGDARAAEPRGHRAGRGWLARP